ncbi:MAG: ABC transporter permease [Candidatus Aminicenantes bacterium]|nr:ABC transporter permease [Candidatus Aminicenantes bacterium]
MAGKRIGRAVLSFFGQLGEVGLLAAAAFRGLFGRPWERRNFLLQLEEVGVRTVPVVTLTAAFGGLVFGLQTYSGFHRYIGPGTEAYGGSIISVGLVRELIPIWVSVMVSGRVASAMTAEIGTMRITEQVDALFSLGADPVKYLVVPRLAACLIMLPCLTLYGDLVGVFCGWLYNALMGVNSYVYVKNTLIYLEIWDLASGMIKALIFGAVIAVVACWNGLNAEGGAKGVGRATTRTVVVNAVSILILNFFLSKALPATLLPK